jgi:hypothetical protein
METDTLLVSSIGTTNYDTTIYSLADGGDCETDLCPLALAELLDIDTAFIPRTEEAVVYDDDLGEGFDELNVGYEFETIPTISERDDVDTVLDTLINHIREIGAESVVLDITHAYRSLPMVMFSSIMYLDALGEVDIRGIYYGEYQDDGSLTTPIIDLTYLHKLMGWHYALQTFETTGSLRAVHQLIDSRKERYFKRGKRPDDLADVVSSLGGASRYFDSGLPLEAGIATRDTIDALDTIDENQFVGPDGSFLAPLAEKLCGFELQQDASKKDEIILNTDELSRQRRFVEFYRDTGRYWLALECGRELFLNRLLYESSEFDQQNWLDRDTRERITDELMESEDSEDKHTEKDAMTLWNQIGNHRNLYAHAGFKQNRAPSETTVENVLTELCKNISNDAFWEEIV